MKKPRIGVAVYLSICCCLFVCLRTCFLCPSCLPTSPFTLKMGIAHPQDGRIPKMLKHKHKKHSVDRLNFLLSLSLSLSFSHSLTSLSFSSPLFQLSRFQNIHLLLLYLLFARRKRQKKQIQPLSISPFPFLFPFSSFSLCS